MSDTRRAIASRFPTKAERLRQGRRGAVEAEKAGELTVRLESERLARLEKFKHVVERFEQAKKDESQ